MTSLRLLGATLLVAVGAFIVTMADGAKATGATSINCKVDGVDLWAIQRAKLSGWLTDAAFPVRDAVRTFDISLCESKPVSACPELSPSFVASVNPVSDTCDKVFVRVFPNYGWRKAFGGVNAFFVASGQSSVLANLTLKCDPSVGNDALALDGNVTVSVVANVTYYNFHLRTGLLCRSPPPSSCATVTEFKGLGCGDSPLSGTNASVPCGCISDGGRGAIKRQCVGGSLLQSWYSGSPTCAGTATAEELLSPRQCQNNMLTNRSYMLDACQ